MRQLEALALLARARRAGLHRHKGPGLQRCGGGSRGLQGGCAGGPIGTGSRAQGVGRAARPPVDDGDGEGACVAHLRDLPAAAASAALPVATAACQHIAPNSAATGAAGSWASSLHWWQAAAHGPPAIAAGLHSTVVRQHQAAQAAGITMSNQTLGTGRCSFSGSMRTAGVVLRAKGAWSAPSAGGRAGASALPRTWYQKSGTSAPHAALVLRYG